MNTGQMMIGVMAMGLLTLTILNFNKGSLTTQDNLIYNKEFILATSVAQSILDEISTKEFDEEIVKGKTIDSENDFSSNLKSEGESYSDFDDIDDYNNYSKTELIPGMGTFSVEVSVNYMTNSLSTSTTQTYNKNVTVRVTNSALMNYYTNKQDTLSMSTLFSQWKML